MILTALLDELTQGGLDLALGLGLAALCSVISSARACGPPADTRHMTHPMSSCPEASKAVNRVMTSSAQMSQNWNRCVWLLMTAGPRRPQHAWTVLPRIQHLVDQVYLCRCGT